MCPWREPGHLASRQREAGWPTLTVGMSATTASHATRNHLFTNNGMSESRRPPRRGRGRRPDAQTPPAEGADAGDNPYRDEAESNSGAAERGTRDTTSDDSGSGSGSDSGPGSTEPRA